MSARNIGIDVQSPQKECADPHCPFHGGLSVRGQIIDGKVVSTKMERSVVVKREYLRYVPKYERYEKRTSRYAAHHPPCIDLRAGYEVRIMECRPISKTKAFVVVEARRGSLDIMGQDYTDDLKAEKAKADKAKAASDAAAATAAKSKKSKEAA